MTRKLVLEIKFVSLEEVMSIHSRMIEVGGGRGDIHDFTLLHSAIERPKAKFDKKFLYPTIWLMAAALLHSLVKNHPFDDGNKRTAYFTTMRFLHKNNYTLKAKDRDAIRFMVDVDVKNLTLEEISKWLQKNSKKNL